MPIKPRPLEVTLTHPGPHLSPDIQEARHHHAEAAGLLRSYPIGRAWRRTAPGTALAQALATIPLLCDEVDRLNALLALTSRRHRDMIAAARATLSAAADGEPDPLYYLRDELTASGYLPGPGNGTGTNGRQR